MLLLLVIFSFCTHTAEGYNYTCLKCTESPRPYTCQTIQHCGSHELCHLEEYVTTIGSRRFNLGCMDEMACATAQVIGRKRADAGCSQCCHGDLCNVKGCGPELHFPDGPVCYSCDSSLGADGCEKVQQCGRDEVCQITTQIQFSGLGERFYSTGCVHKQDTSCQLSGKGGCRYCCDSNLCNAVDPCFSRLNSTTSSTYTTASTSHNDITSIQTASITKTKTGTTTAATTPDITSTQYSTKTTRTTIATTTNSASLSTILYNGPCIDESLIVCRYDALCSQHPMRCPKLCKLCV